eukprot:TRINITY_DN10037_c0_g1_i1.p1 TRINITY_DN10037_c0_g1~~TRINITY_DN10037_c0_g1_i1.p1  ORF type:complete len:521 (+),score=88.70 TRINITY_DN10037_c0_g1_i1:59-1564(+)
MAEKVFDGIWLVTFNTEWCEACQEIIEVFKKMLPDVAGRYNLAVVNCDEGASEDVCQAENILKLPTVRLYGEGLMVAEYDLYKEDLTLSPQTRYSTFVADAVEEHNCLHSSPVVKLTKKNFFNAFFNSEKPESIWFVKFFTTWCPHCQEVAPKWELFASQVEEKKRSGETSYNGFDFSEIDVRVADIDCGADFELCSYFNVGGYPTLRKFSSKEFDDQRQRTPTEFWQFLFEDNDQGTEVAEVNAGFESEYVYDLTSSNYDNLIGNGEVWMIKYYAPWCGHCQALAPAWDEFGRRSLETSVQHGSEMVDVNVGRVNCEDEPQICQNEGISGYPTLQFVMETDGERRTEEYGGERDVDSFFSFVEEQINLSGEPVESSVIEFGSDDFAKGIARGKWIVMFYAPWCGHCKRLKPTWETLAQMVNTNSNDYGFSVAKVNCVDNSDFCFEKQQIEGYPTLKVYINGEFISEYEDSRELQSIVEYVQAARPNIAPPTVADPFAHDL